MGSNVLDKRGGVREALARVGAEVNARSFFEECEAEAAADRELRKLERESRRFFAGQKKPRGKGRGKGSGRVKRGMRAQTKLTPEQELALNGWQD